MSGLNTPVRYDVTATGDQTIDALLQGNGWNTTAITYAFPTDAASYVNYTTGSGDGDSDEPFNGLGSISAAQVDTALFAMEKDFGSAANDGFSIEGFTNLDFSAGAESTATIRIAQSTVPPTAWGYYPAATKTGGDIWFGTAYVGTSNDYRTPVAGNYAWHTMLHEIGHAMGLKHGHETFKYGALPSQEDSLEFSIMTYRTYVGDNTSGWNYRQFDAPQTFMMSDIAALQQIYGADFTTNGGNTTYSWSAGSGNTVVNGEVGIAPGDDTIFATIWDGGGIDTYNLSAYQSSVTIDLNPGGYSVFSAAQLADLGGGPNNGLARGNIFNALLYQGDTRSLIENAIGGAGADSLIGNQADNALNGGALADTMSGGLGNDTYYVENIADIVNEAANQGTDTIFSSVSYGLGGRYVENLTLTGSGNAGASGNSLVNVIVGNTGNNVIDGGALADTMSGGIGNDTYYVENIADIVNEAFDQGTDTIFSSVSYGLGGRYVENLTLTGSGNAGASGNSLVNVIVGNSGNNVIDGGALADTMSGGLGNDTYYVENIADIVNEAFDQGTDTIFSSVSYGLGGRYVENLTLTGSGNAGASGNSLVNVIVGNTGNNVIDGGALADTMSGGLGNDTYYVENIADIVNEAFDQGNDTIVSSVTYGLGGRYVETLQLTGSAAINGYGNSQANTIHGNSGNNTLTGQGGNDTFVFNTALGASNVDTLNDFNVIDDTIQLAASIFNAIVGTGTLSAMQFLANPAGVGKTGDTRIVYESGTGNLLYDNDGSGTGTSVLFAKLATGLALTNNDFFIA